MQLAVCLLVIKHLRSSDFILHVHTSYVGQMCGYLETPLEMHATNSLKFRQTARTDASKVSYHVCAKSFMASSRLTLICETRDLQCNILLELRFLKMFFSCLAHHCVSIRFASM